MGVVRSLAAVVPVAFVFPGVLPTFDVGPIQAIFVNVTGVPSSDVDTSTEAASVKVTFRVYTLNTVRLHKTLVLKLGSAEAATAAFGTPVESVRVEPTLEPCAADGADDRCDPVADDEFSSEEAHYHFYFYDDERSEGAAVPLWEWPRASPNALTFKNNGLCDDGGGWGAGGTPAGHFYAIFGGPRCASHSLAMDTGNLSGCERQRFVSCGIGLDCTDCRRSASWRASLAGSARRQLEAVPADTMTLPSANSPSKLVAFFTELSKKAPRHVALPPAHEFWWRRFNQTTAKFAFATQRELDRALRA